MIVWILNHYAANQYFDHGGRHYEFAKFLIQAGYSVRIFCASTVHNSNVNTIRNGNLYHEDVCDSVPFVFIRARNYEGNGRQRIFNMIDYYRNVQKAARYFENPDVVIGSSVHPLACVAAIQMGKKLHCKIIAEIRDLWPESIVSYSIRNKNDFFIKLLYRLEKWIYTKADKIIFTMEGGRDYIVNKGWDKEHGGMIDIRKVHHINNGIDLAEFSYNSRNYKYFDDDLDDKSHFKVVYTGSIRTVNEVALLLRAAEALSARKEDRIHILIFGDGDELAELASKAQEEGLRNITFKGRVGKSYVPSILIRSDACVLNWKATPIIAFGMSMNKLFEYLAAGKPIVENNKPGYDLIEKCGCGVSENIENGEQYADVLVRLANLEKNEYLSMCDKALELSKEYDFEHLSKKLISVIQS